MNRTKNKTLMFNIDHKFDSGRCGAPKLNVSACVCVCVGANVCVCARADSHFKKQNKK